MTDFTASLDAAANIDIDIPAPPVGLDVGAALGSVTKAKLMNATMPLDMVVFDLNPETLDIKYSATYDQRYTAAGKGNSFSGATTSVERLLAGHAPHQWKGTKPVAISFKGILDQDYAMELIDLNPVGEDSVRRRLDTLGSWCRPEPGFMEMLLGAGIAAISSALGLGSAVNILRSPPMLIFQWGDPFNGGFLVNGYLTSVGAKITRFSAGGNPLRAEVSVTFQEEPGGLLAMLQNPTSGGVAGRKTHTVTDGENLQRIAMTTYGRPQNWRQLADANGIDDPMRVRPGRKVILPNREEIRG
jgi:hypothetical protein